MVLMIKGDLGLDWNNPEQVLNFEEKIERFRKERASWKWTRKISWFAQRFLPSLFLVVLLYGSSGYIIHSNESQLKHDKEQEMKEEWLKSNDTGEMPIFEYYTFENWMFINCYSYAVVFSQTMGLVLCTSYHFASYRWWNVIGVIMHLFCLPVDVLLLYKAPYGALGSLLALVFIFIPYYIVPAEAIYPEEENTFIKTPNGITRKNINAWFKHVSLGCNKRYNLIARWTWDGYKFFSTISLLIYLLQGPPDQLLMGIIILILEAIPQLIICLFNIVHWHGPFSRTSLELFCVIVDIPLSLMYFTYYSNPETKNIVICKLLVDKLDVTKFVYSDYVGTYLYFEEPVTKEEIIVFDQEEQRGIKQKKVNRYDNSNMMNVLFWQSVYFAICPFMAMYEVAIAGRSSLTRDLKGSLTSNEVVTMRQPFKVPYKPSFKAS